MGLPGLGKTTLASKLVTLINAKWLNADYVVWVDTIKEGRFADTNAMFVNQKNMTIM